MIGRKLEASAVNLTVVFIGSSPFLAYGFDIWRLCFLALFFFYSLIFAERCLGQMACHTYQNQPTDVAFAALYTASAATLLFWLWIPFDLALANGLFLQLPCLILFRNTPHGLIAGRQTMTETEYLWDAIMRGQCPDCHKESLQVRGANTYCKVCNSMFYASDMIVQRVKTSPMELFTVETIH